MATALPIPRHPADLTSEWLSTALNADVKDVAVTPIGTGQTGATYRVSAAYRYTVVSYIAIGAFAILSGMLEPGGAFLVLISAAAASLGGESGLAWGPQLLQDPRLGTPPEDPLQVARDVRWIVAGALVAITFVGVFGRGLPL